jgi:hypothetical protein
VGTEIYLVKSLTLAAEKRRGKAVRWNRRKPRRHVGR